MCGIAGFNFENRELIDRMCSVIAHRGPDQSDSFVDQSVSLGHRRLSIIDTSVSGRQPMSNYDNSVWIVFNGEIYNFQELKNNLDYPFRTKTDTEVILALYHKYGTGLLEKLNGDFAFCIYDKNKKLFFLARDRLGIKPVYYWFDKKTSSFFFASEIKALLEHSGIKRVVDLAAFDYFLAFRYNWTENTLVKGVKKLLPGCAMVFDLNKKSLRVWKYWSVAHSSEITNKQFAVEKAKELLGDAVEKQLMSDVPLGAYLSGGIDSSTIVALMSQHSKKVRTFSVGFGYGSEVDELDFARKVSDSLGTKHKEVVIKADMAKTLPDIVWHCDEPIADPALIPIYLLSKEAKKQVTVVLTGDGGDEVFAGYEQYKFLPRIWNANQNLRKLASTVLKITPSFALNKVFKYSSSLGEKGIERAQKVLLSRSKSGMYTEFVSIFDDAERAECTLTPKNNCIKRDLNSHFSGSNDFLVQLQSLEQTRLLPENFLMKNDKMTMAFGIEARVPLLDYRLVELASKFSPDLRVNGNTEKFVLREIAKDLLPEEIANRKKQRFYVPIDRWLSEDLDSMAKELLSKREIEKTQMLKYDPVKKAFEKFDKSPLFYARQLWSLLTFQIWYKKFILQEL